MTPETEQIGPPPAAVREIHAQRKEIQRLTRELARVTKQMSAYYHAVVRIECEATKRQDNPLAALLLIRDIANRVLPPESEASS